MSDLRRAAGAMVIAAILLAIILVGRTLLIGRAQDLPWTKLALDQPIGLFTGRKLAALTHDRVQCLALLDRAGIAYRPIAEPASAAGKCGFEDGVRLDPGGALPARLSPAGASLACPVAAALAKWQWDVVQPAAQRHLGARVVGIDHLGSYHCRRMYGRTARAWSEHATADAIDIAGFRLSDGRRISVAKDWAGDGERAAFLHAVRGGACRLFATVLSPDYNAAHRDHLHLDQAERGAWGMRSCR